MLFYAIIKYLTVDIIVNRHVSFFTNNGACFKQFSLPLQQTRYIITIYFSVSNNYMPCSKPLLHIDNVIRNNYVSCLWCFPSKTGIELQMLMLYDELSSVPALSPGNNILNFKSKYAVS
jgi:hypothetical protein